MPEGIAEAVIAGGALVITATVTGLFAWKNAREARRAALAARQHSAAVEAQVTPTNGTRLAEYIERTDQRLEHLIDLVVEARDAAKGAATQQELHEATYRHEKKE